LFNAALSCNSLGAAILDPIGTAAAFRAPATAVIDRRRTSHSFGFFCIFLDFIELVYGYDVVLDWPSFDQVLLDNSLDDIDSAGVIPGPLGINDCYRALRADLKAIRFRSIYSALSGQVQILESMLQVLPGLEAEFSVRTPGPGLVATQEDVALDLLYPHRFNDLIQLFAHT
jgi:hypothetical protein